MSDWVHLATRLLARMKGTAPNRILSDDLTTNQENTIRSDS
jgi:hypothetical protein